jgi:hypothetical protein
MSSFNSGPAVIWKAQCAEKQLRMRKMTRQLTRGWRSCRTPPAWSFEGGRAHLITLITWDPGWPRADAFAAAKEGQGAAWSAWQHRFWCTAPILKVHKRENFVGSDFRIRICSKLQILIFCKKKLNFDLTSNQGVPIILLILSISRRKLTKFVKSKTKSKTTIGTLVTNDT